MKLKENVFLKAGAVFLLLITLAALVFGTVGTFIFSEAGLYTQSREDARRFIYRDVTMSYMYRAISDYEDDLNGVYRYPSSALPTETNFRYEIFKTDTGERVAGTYAGEDYLYTFSFTRDVVTGGYGYYFSTEYTVHGYVKGPITANDRYMTLSRWFDTAYDHKYTVIALAIAGFLSSVGLFCYLIISAGHKRGEDGISLNFIDKIPFDLLLVIPTVAAVGFLLFFSEALDAWRSPDIAVIYLLLTVLLFFTTTLLFILTVVSFAARAKAGGWWKNTVIYKVCAWIFRLISRIFRGIFSALRYVFRHISSTVKAIALFLALSLLEIVILVGTGSYNIGPYILFWFFERLLLGGLLVFGVINFHLLRRGGKKLSEGDLSHQIDTKYMLFGFKEYADDLNNISAGMSRAVDAKMKSERFKTELITNVSHDIKTPLTSIVNYVDLIKKEETENERIKEYTEVLERQSARLKKLTEDLVEASKASTGNINVNLERCQPDVLLSQIAGEYEERFRALQLEPVINITDEPLYIMADGRLCFRIFDNLMNNICKYALPGTRVYLSLAREGDEAVLTFRNISKYALNLTSEELMERFVRGDASRHTEGSGLGLSIAKSLTELQKGTMALYVDGDLFKAVIRFPAEH